MSPPSDDERRRRERRARERSRRGHPVGRELPGAAVPPVVARLGEVVRAGTHLDVLLEVSALLDEVERDGPELDSRWLVSALVEHENVVTTTALARARPAAISACRRAASPNTTESPAAAAWRTRSGSRSSAM